MTKTLILFAALFLLTVVSAERASAQETRIKWFGHAAFSITTPGGKVLLIDPWLSNPSNPEAKGGRDPLAAVPKVDYILLTHGGKVLLIDPWLSNPSNPEAKGGRDPLAAVPKVDYILLTHGGKVLLIDPWLSNPSNPEAK